MVQPTTPQISPVSLSRRGVVTGGLGLAAALSLGGVVPTRAQVPSDAAVPADGTAVAWTKYNLDTITSEQILTIPGAGEQMTHEFAEYRPYTSIAQFRQEIGKYVDEDVVTGYERYLFVPVDVTQANADTIAQLPGVDGDLADELAQAVPYASEEAFLAALTDEVSAEQLAAIPTYLSSAAAPTVAWTKFNLNTLTSDEILAIPGAGDQMTHEFPEYRPYTSIGQFRQEIGKYVDDDVVVGYERYVFVPVDVTQADADTIAQLPGVGADLAAELAASVPFASTDAFLAALDGQVSVEQLAAIPAYLA